MDFADTAVVSANDEKSVFVRKLRSFVDGVDHLADAFIADADRLHVMRHRGTEA